MPRITVVSLDGVSEWITTIGFEEEDVVQLQQAQTYTLLHQLFRKYKGFVFPISYNHFIVLSNGVTRLQHEEVYRHLSSQIPFRIRIVSVVHPYPFTAQLKASIILKKVDESIYFENGEEDPNIVLFLDVSGFIKALEITFFESYINIIEVYSHLLNIISRYGGLACYLGGSIVLSVMPQDTYKRLLDVLPDYIKAGVGVSLVPRRAIGLARKALYELKHSFNDKKYLTYVDEDTLK